MSEKKAKQWCGAKGGIPHFDTSAKVRLGGCRQAEACGGLNIPTCRCCCRRRCVLPLLLLEWPPPPPLTRPTPAPPNFQPPQEDVNVDDAFATIARNALRNEAEEEPFVPETVELGAAATPRRNQSSCC